MVFFKFERLCFLRCTNFNKLPNIFFFSSFIVYPFRGHHNESFSFSLIICILALTPTNFMTSFTICNNHHPLNTGDTLRQIISSLQYFCYFSYLHPTSQAKLQIVIITSISSFRLINLCHTHFTTKMLLINSSFTIPPTSLLFFYYTMEEQLKNSLATFPSGLLNTSYIHLPSLHHALQLYQCQHLKSLLSIPHS